MPCGATQEVSVPIPDANLITTAVVNKKVPRPARNKNIPSNETKPERTIFMDKRTLSKYAAKLVVGTTVGSLVTKALIANAPKTEKYKVAEMTGAMAGYVAQEQMAPLTDAWVDDFWNRREAKKQFRTV